MIFEEFPPAHTVASDIECWWRFRVEAHEPESLSHAIVPDGAVSLSARREPGGAVFVVVVGPAQKARVTTVRRGVDYVGARLSPGGTLRPLGASPPDLIGALIDESRLDPAFAAWLRTALADLFEPRPAGAVDAAFAAWPFARAPADRIVSAVAEAIIARHGDVRVADLAREAGLGERQLHRRFKAATGFGPKVFARLRRVRRACVLALEDGARLSDVAAAAGFVDQAHLTHEIAECFGVPPGEVAAYLRQIRHSFADRNLQDARPADCES